MKKSWQNDSCSTVQACYNIYQVSVAAALWCGVPPAEVQDELSRATPTDPSTAPGRAIRRHPYLSCLEPRMRAIHFAIDAGELAACKPDGNNPGGHVAYERRHVKGIDLKEWAKKIAPSERPEFLFDDAERETHPTFKTEDFNALKANCDASELRLKQKNSDFLAVQLERNDLIGERNSLKAMADKMGTPGVRAGATYLNIIGGLLELLQDQRPTKADTSNQTKIIDALVAAYGDKDGISERNLQGKFAEANRSLNES